MTATTLAGRIAASGTATAMLCNAPNGPFVFPVKAEISNWRSEQEAWRNSVVFQDMSHHMADTEFTGPDVIELLARFGINSFTGFGPMQAKQYVACNADGQVIGDAILFGEAEDRVSIVGKPSVANWLAFNARGTRTRITANDRPSPHLADRRRFRFQVQGPRAQELMERVHGGPLPDMPFFRMGRFMLAGVAVTALNHRMSGAPGYEFWGDTAGADTVRAAIFEAGAAFGLRQIGGRNYPVTAQESGWWASPVPAIYTDPRLEEYRQWLPADSYEATLSVGGSLVIDDIAAAYMTPRDLGYGFMARFDHDFHGRAALEAAKDRPGRHKVRLLWNDEDVLRVFAAMLGDGPRFKGLELPTAQFSTCPLDEVTQNGRRVGASNYPAYSANLRRWFSLATVDEALAVDGTPLEVTWGEPGGGSAKPTVEPHEQVKIRVQVQSKAVHRN